MLHVQETDQRFPIPAEIGADDNSIKRALAGVVPYIDSAKLERSEEKDIVTIKVTKSHAPKGAGDPGSIFTPMLEQLENSMEDGRNPVIALFLEVETMKKQLHRLEPHEIIALDQKIASTLERGEEIQHSVRQAITYLVNSPALPAKVVPVGF
jgi:ribosomal protein L16 Arg81 hydroxylase